MFEDMCAIREFEYDPQRDQDQGRSTRGSPTITSARRTFPSARKPPPSAWPSLLTPDDHIYGSHRSHGEILAKGFSAIRHISDDGLLEVMRSYRDGAILGRWRRATRERCKELARKFLVYGAYSEIFARETGFNRGLGGSMHAFFAPFGIYPNNAIVGGSGSIAPGAALFKRVNRKPGIVVANIGDASFGCGPVWEGITFASMDQYRKLWDPALGGGLPIIFNCMNNFYGMGGQPCGRNHGLPVHRPHRRRGQPRADARRARQRLRPAAGDRRLPAQEGDPAGRARDRSCSTPSPTASAATRRRTPPATAPRRRSRSGSRPTRSSPSARSSSPAAATPEHALDKTREGVELDGLRDVQAGGRPRRRLRASALDSDLVGRSCSPTARWRSSTTAAPEFLQSLAENPRVQQIRGKIRTPPHEGKPVPKMKAFNVRDGIFEALLHRFCIDPTHGRLRRGESRLGRRLRRLPRPDGGCCPTIACSTRRSRKPALSARRWATRWRAAGRWPS